MDFQKSKTKENLARAFAGECQDGAFYQFIIKDCKQDYKYLSNLLKGIAKNEMAHAGMYYKTIVKLAKNTATNIDIKAGYAFAPFAFPKSLEAALETERKEALKIYPEFARIAREEGFEDAAKVFEAVSHDEQHHITMLTQICQKIKDNTLYNSDCECLWLCSNCAHHEYSKHAWKTCPSCGFPQGFVEFSIEKMLPATQKKILHNEFGSNPPKSKTSPTSAKPKSAAIKPASAATKQAATKNKQSSTSKKK